MPNIKRKISFSPDRLEIVMKAKGIKPKQIYTDAGCSYENFKVWKRAGKIMPDDLRKISEFLNVSMDYLCGYDMHLSKTPPLYGDYVQDPEGYVIPSYSDRTIYDIQKNLSQYNRLFESWMNAQPLFHFVNETLEEAGQDPAQMKEFKEVMQIFGITYEGRLAEHLFKEIAEDIQLRRKYKGMEK